MMGLNLNTDCLTYSVCSQGEKRFDFILSEFIEKCFHCHGLIPYDFGYPWQWWKAAYLCVCVCVRVCVCFCQPHRPKWRQLSHSAVQTRTILVEILHKCFSQYREIALPSSGPCRDLFEIQLWLTAALRELWTKFTVLTAIIKHTSVCSDSLCVKSFHITNDRTRWFTAMHMHL